VTGFHDGFFTDRVVAELRLSLAVMHDLTCELELLEEMSRAEF